MTLWYSRWCIDLGSAADPKPQVSSVACGEEALLWLFEMSCLDFVPAWWPLALSISVVFLRMLPRQSEEPSHEPPLLLGLSKTISLHLITPLPTSWLNSLILLLLKNSLDTVICILYPM